MRRVSASWKNIGKQKNRSNPVLLHVKLFLAVYGFIYVLRHAFS